jgi:deoxycytidylate deaminase
VIVRDKRVIAGGYNGSPPGEPHCDDVDHLMVEGHCIPGNTIISKFQPGRYNTGHRSIKQIYENWQDPHKRGAMKRMKVRSVTEEGFIVPDHIEDVWCVGKKPLFRFTTRLGRIIRVTPGQLILTENGWEPATRIREGHKIALNGVEPFDDPQWLKRQYEELGKTQVTLAAMLGCSRQTIKRRLDKFGIERREFRLGGWNRGMRRDGMPRYKGEDIDDTHARERSRRYGLQSECDVCGSAEDLQVHHLDGRPQNDADKNLLTLCVGCHQVAHTPHAKIKKIIFDSVSTKERSKKDERVFDLTTRKNHNYIGNGVVLHNCVRTIHSEMNALVQCALDCVTPEGADVYTTASPCFDCAKALIRARIKRVVVGQDYESRYGLSSSTKDKLEDAGIVVAYLPLTQNDFLHSPTTF